MPTINPILLNLPVPILTPRLILRPPIVGDGILVNAAIIESLTLLQQFMPWANHPPSVEETEVFVRQAAANWILKNNSEPYLPLLLFDKITKQLLGACGYHNFDWEIPCLETGYWLRTSYTGHGLMTEAINALTQYAFKQLRVKRIAITCDPQNARSKKIPERLGYHLESVTKANRHDVNGEICDTLVFTRHNLDNLPALEVTWNKTL